jgi:hypothetical protein
LDREKLTITVFVVGQDAELPHNHALLRSIADAGHEIGNHSFHHDPWMHDYPLEELARDFQRSETAIFAATGERPRGFRGPGFSLSRAVLQILSDRGYLYDATVFPTYLGPAARMYYFLRSRISAHHRQRLNALFGRFRDGLQSNRPFTWTTPNPLVEIPVTTMPWFKTPIHASYLNYLASWSRTAARAYFWQAQTLCRWCSLGPSFLLHPTDFLGREDETDLSFFPAMNRPANRKIEWMRDVIRSLQRRFLLATLEQQATAVVSSPGAVRDPRWTRPGHAG